MKSRIFSFISPLTVLFIYLLIRGFSLINEGELGVFYGIIISAFSIIPLALHLLILTLQNTFPNKLLVNASVAFLIFISIQYFILTHL